MIHIGNAPCSWGILEFRLQGETANYGRVLDEMQETGYEGTELGDWGFFPTDPAVLRGELGARGLSLLGAFVPVALKDPRAHDAGMETALRTARLLVEVEGDAPYFILADDNAKDPVRTQYAGRIRPEQGLTAAEWDTFAGGAQWIAERVRQATGLRTAFHHHCGGYVETPAEVDKLLSLTDPHLLGLCFDTGHYSFGGGDALAGLRRHASRIWHVHFKDFAPSVGAQAAAKGWDYLESVRRGVFCHLGQGAVDWAGVVAQLRSMQYEGWIVVEQDLLPGQGEPRDVPPRESARRNRAFLSGLAL
jgi:inosose dehydratase